MSFWATKDTFVDLSSNKIYITRHAISNESVFPHTPPIPSMFLEVDCAVDVVQFMLGHIYDFLFFLFQRTNILIGHESGNKHNQSYLQSVTKYKIIF